MSTNRQAVILCGAISPEREVSLRSGKAGFFPGIILYLTYWYPAQRRGRMTAMFMTRLGGKGRPSLCVEALLQFASENGIDWTKWAHVNNGMKRMNIAKKVRALIAAGQNIRHGHKVVFKGQGDQQDAKAA